MTIDDESSIYVGGLPYDATEESIRRTFDLYGAIVAVKIINDRSTRGTGYGFVTFTNPRSAVNAIDDMNGRTIDGRVMKVNGVRSRGARSNFNRDRFHDNHERNGDWDQSRPRGRESYYDRDRDRYRNRHTNWSRERDRSREGDDIRDRGHEALHDHDQARHRMLNTSVHQHRGNDDYEREPDGNNALDNEEDRALSFEKGKEMDRLSEPERNIEEDRHGIPRRKNSVEHSSGSDGDRNEQFKRQLERSSQRFEQMKKEVSLLEGLLEEKGLVVLDLQKKSKILEDAVISAKKHSSYRLMQLVKMQKCLVQVKDCTERLKSSEREFQGLVDRAVQEFESDSGTLLNGDLTNGNG